MNNQRFLARIAAPLNPARPPYYVAAPTRPGELVGWYVEIERDAPAPLGSNVYFAQARLEQLVDQARERVAA